MKPFFQNKFIIWDGLNAVKVLLRFILKQIKPKENITLQIKEGKNFWYNQILIGHSRSWTRLRHSSLQTIYCLEISASAQDEIKCTFNRGPRIAGIRSEPDWIWVTLTMWCWEEKFNPSHHKNCSHSRGWQPGSLAQQAHWWEEMGVQWDWSFQLLHFDFIIYIRYINVFLNETPSRI